MVLATDPANLKEQRGYCRKDFRLGNHFEKVQEGNRGTNDDQLTLQTQEKACHCSTKSCIDNIVQFPIFSQGY